MEVEDPKLKIVHFHQPNGSRRTMSRQELKWNEPNKLLVEKGADVNYINTDKDGNVFTPLILASKPRSKEVCKFLIKNGAELNFQDKYGWTALKYASERGYDEICELLIDAGADIELCKEEYIRANQQNCRKVIKKIGGISQKEKYLKLQTISEMISKKRISVGLYV